MSTTPSHEPTWMITAISTSGTTMNRATSNIIATDGTGGSGPARTRARAAQASSASGGSAGPLVSSVGGELLGPPEVVDLVELALEHAPAGPGQVVEVAPRGVQGPVQLVHLLHERVPLLRERAQAPEDLTRRPLHAEVVDRLTDHREHGEQRERRTEHELATERVVEDRPVLFLDERVELLVRDEEQHAVDRRARRLDVATRGQGLHVAANVAQEVVACAALLEVRLGVEVAQVVVERELHVHVQREPVRQEEREVGDAGVDRRAACGS